MHEKKLKALATKSFATMFTVVMISFCATKYNDSKIYVSAVNLNEQLSASLMNHKIDEENEYVNIETGDIVKEIGDNYIKITKNSIGNSILTTEDLYKDCRLKVKIDNLDEKIYSEQAVTFSNEKLKREKVSLNYEFNPDNMKYSAVFDISLDKVYVQTVYEDMDNFFIELKSPHEVYDKVIVVDAGHGGNDVGTASEDKKYYEKDINLSVVLELKKLLDEDSTYKVYYTRLEDEKVYLNPRVNLVNAVEPDLFLSIHCNGSEYISAKGTEGLYGSTKNSGKISSKRFANICVEEVSNALHTKVRGVVKKNDIYIIGNAKSTVSLIELGFMSNDDDMEILKDKKYRKLAAEALYKAINRAFEEIKEVK